MGIPKFIIENWGKKIELSEEEKKFDELTQKYIESLLKKWENGLTIRKNADIMFNCVGISVST